MGRGQTFGQVDFENHGAAMTTRAVVTADQCVTDLLEHD
jgi:hypothetical protein